MSPDRRFFRVMTDLPKDPMTELAIGAAIVHELFEAYKAAGFTEPQALALCCAVVGAMAAEAQRTVRSA